MVVLTADEIEFGCEFGDLVCVAFEAQARGLSEFLAWVAEITLANHPMAPGSVLWESAIGESGNWLGIAIVVSLGILMIGIMRGILDFSGRQMWWSIIGVCSGIPSTYLALTLGGALLEVSDQISDAVLERIGGPEGFAEAIHAAQQFGSGDDATGATATAVMTLTGTSLFLPVSMMMLLLILGMVVMNFALAFRNFGLMILIAFAPLAYMGVTMKGGWQLARSWALAGIALLIAKPLMFGMLAMILSTAGEARLFSGETLTLGIGLIVVAFMPLLAFSFFSFLGAGNASGDQVGSQMGARASQGSKQVVQQTTSKVTSVGRGGRAGAAGAPGKSPAPSGGASSTGAAQSSRGSGTSGNAAGSASSTSPAVKSPAVPEPPQRSASTRPPAPPSGPRF
jgi:hypothetical protein